ncbi:Rrf2 family transcriptional regulator [Planctomycetota bacterium]|nr:Rrf2 family transcriptional regulator [Planctomycetota bacterium]
MIRYGKTTQQAIAAVSKLAEVYDGGKTRLSSGQIAEARGLSQAIVAKLLVILSQAGIVDGTPGPRGGYALSREPGDIRFWDIVEQFERQDNDKLCPFGPGWCGSGKEPCPMHDQFVKLQESTELFLRETTFDVFCIKPADV